MKSEKTRRYDISFRANDAGCDRGGDAVVRGISVTIKHGEALQLFGANGAGKTSVLRLFAGLVPLADGELAWRQAEGPWIAAPPKNDIFFLGHECGVKLQLTAFENLKFWARVYDIPRGNRAAEIISALDRFGMRQYADRECGRLSAGQRRRVDIARALLARRAMWILDEPCSALDEDGEAIVADVIRDHLHASGLAAIATHDPINLPSERLALV